MTIITKYPRAMEFDGFPKPNDLPIAANVKVTEGAACGFIAASGLVREMTDGDEFAGWAEGPVDNTGGAAGARDVRLRERTRVLLTVSSVDGPDDIGKTVYASGPNTFSLTQGSSTAIGKIARHDSGTKCWVDTWALQSRSL